MFAWQKTESFGSETKLDMFMKNVYGANMGEKVSTNSGKVAWLMDSSLSSLR